MLLGQPVSWNAYESNALGNGDSTLGTAVVLGVTDSEGTPPTQIIASTAFEALLMRVTVHLGTATGVDKRVVLDIGTYDGSTFRELVANLNISKQGPVERARTFLLPLRVPSGSDLRARCQGGTSNTVQSRVFIELFGKPDRPHLWRAASKFETVGYTTSLGTALTNTTHMLANGAAISGATWLSLGTLARAGFCAIPSFGCSDASSTGQTCCFQIAVGDGSNKQIIIDNAEYNESGNAELGVGGAAPLVYGEWPAGTEFWVRGVSNLATLDASYNAMVHVGLL